MDDIYKNIEECNPNKKQKILNVFDDTIDHNSIVTGLFIISGLFVLSLSRSLILLL